MMMWKKLTSPKMHMGWKWVMFGGTHTECQTQLVNKLLTRAHILWDPHW